MDARVPLCTVLCSPGRKYAAVPSRTYTAPASSSFFRYLRSDDTRLPRHRLLQTYFEPAENYNTYAGEEDWSGAQDGGAGASGSTHEIADDDEVPVGPPPRADAVVDWVAEVLSQPWAEDGVVLCGRYCVADDCAWATSSRSSRLATVREVFVAMRGSNKFFQDVKHQLDKANTGVAEFTLAKAIAAEEAKELRVFIPCSLTVRGRSDRTDASTPRCEVGPLLYEYAGVTQRVTEACFPTLMQWSEEEHDVIFRRVVERVREANLLERTLETDPKWCDRLVAQFRRHTRATTPPAHTEDDTQYWLFLSVDVLFETLQLPIHLLSAKARLFPPSTLTAHAKAPAPFIREPLDDTTSDNIASDKNGTATQEHEDEEEEEDWEEAREAADVRSFLRLFRDEFNWNQYVDLLRHRLESHADSGGAPMRYFCAIASEASDLVTCGDTLTKRGLALEFSRPELLAHNAKAMQHVQEFIQQQQQ